MLASANTARFLFDCPAVRQDWRVVGFAAEQGLSSPGWCELELVCPRHDLDAGALIGKAGVLTLFDVDHPSFIHGEIAAASQGAVGKRFTTYHVTLRPKLWQLEFRSGLRIFQDQSVPDIVRTVLKDAGISGQDVRFELTGTYAPRSYCVQYRESDFAFVHRLLAEEGLFYCVEHSVERHVLVIGDNRSSFKPIAGNNVLPFAPAVGMVSSEQSVVEFQLQAQLASGAVMLRDFNFEKPAQQLQQQAASGRFAMLEQYDYPGAFSDTALGKHHAQMRQQAHQATAQIISGRSDSQRLLSGRRFTLAKHPRKDLNSEYTLIATRLQGRQPQVLEEGASGEGSSFSLDFRAIPAVMDFRPPALHPKPRIDGVQTAFVTGPKGEEIYTDAHGRIKVQFHWDRQGKRDQNSSCWLRVAQGWAGNQWGSFVLPRIGQEVLVTFLDGDPDRPLVTGSLYNASMVPLYDLPANKTRTTFKSQSTPGGGGFNELRIDDSKGSEQLFLHAEKDANLFVNNDWKQSVDHDTHLIVQKNAFESVGKDTHLTVTGHRNIKVGKSLSENVGADLQLKVGSHHLLQAGRELHMKGGQSMVLDAGMSITLKAGSGTIVLDPSGVSITGRKVRINSGGGAGSAKAALPVAPKNPAPVDAGKPGNKVSPGLSNVFKKVEKIPFGAGAATQPALKSTTSATAGSGAKAATTGASKTLAATGASVPSLPGLPATAKRVAGGAPDLASLLPAKPGDLTSKLSFSGNDLLQQAADAKGPLLDQAGDLLEKGKDLAGDARTKATKLLREGVADLLPPEALATLAALDPTGLLDELLPEHFSFSE